MLRIIYKKHHFIHPFKIKVSQIHADGDRFTKRDKFQKLANYFYIFVGDLRSMKWYEKGYMLESILEQNAELPALKMSRTKLNKFTEYTRTIEYFTSNLGQLSLKERAILYRVLAILGAKDVDAKLLTSLESDFYKNSSRLDLSTILNLSIGADLVRGSAREDFYRRTTGHVYMKLMDTMKHLFVQLKVIQLTKHAEESIQEKEFLAYLDKTFEILHVNPTDLQVALSLIDSYSSLFNSQDNQKIASKLTSPKNLNAIKAMTCEDQTKLLLTSWQLIQKIGDADSLKNDLATIMHHLGDGYLTSLKEKIPFKENYHVSLLFHQNNQEGAFFRFNYDSQKLCSQLSRINTNSELIWFMNTIVLYTQIKAVQFRKTGASQISKSVLDIVAKKLDIMGETFDLSTQHLLPRTIDQFIASKETASTLSLILVKNLSSLKFTAMRHLIGYTSRSFRNQLEIEALKNDEIPIEMRILALMTQPDRTVKNQHTIMQILEEGRLLNIDGVKSFPTLLKKASRLNDATLAKQLLVHLQKSLENLSDIQFLGIFKFSCLPFGKHTRTESGEFEIRNIIRLLDLELNEANGFEHNPERFEGLKSFLDRVQSQLEKDGSRTACTHLKLLNQYYSILTDKCIDYYLGEDVVRIGAPDQDIQQVLDRIGRIFGEHLVLYLPSYPYGFEIDMEMALDSNGSFVNPREKSSVVYRLPFVFQNSRKIEEDSSTETAYDLMNQRVRVKLLEMMYPVVVIDINESDANFKEFLGNQIVAALNTFAKN